MAAVTQGYIFYSLFFALLLQQTWCQSPPGSPTIIAPTFIVEGNTVTLTCTSEGGSPAPTVKWYRGSNNGQLVDETSTTSNGKTTNSYSFVADPTHHLSVYECQVDNNVLQNPLTTTWFFQVYTQPNNPTLTGPTNLSPGATNSWTCTSKGGNPAPTMSLRIGSSVFTNGVSQTSVLEADNSYTVTSILSWAANVNNNGQTLYCDVQHQETLGNTVQTVSLQITVNDPLSINAPQTSYQQSVGTLAVLVCQVTGTATSVSWYFNNQLLTISGRYSNGDRTNPSLTISSVILSDAGSYYCQATNGINTVNSNTITLDVLGSPPTATVNVPAYSQTTGNTITLECTVSSPNSALQSVSWTFNNGASTQIITQFSNTAKYSGSTTATPSLTIFNLASSDVGTYTCTATNTVGTGTSSPTTLSVTGSLLTVTILQSQYSVLVGQQITMTCTVSGTPTQTSVFWRKTDSNVQTDVDVNGNNRYSGATTTNPSLTITNSQLSDEGTYTCYATNSVGTSNSQTTFLDITGGVPVVTLGGTNYQVQVGNSITIGCTVTANPAVSSVYWTRNVGGQATNIGPSTNPSKYGGSTTVTPSLTIYNAELSDEGNYKCFATNSIGTGSSQQGFLDVSGEVPSVQITLPNYQANVGSSITLGCSVVANPAHYQVYWRKTSGGQTTNIAVVNSGGKYSGSTVNSPSLTITNAAISDDATYVCFATNSIGTGQSTSTSLDVVGNIPTVVIQQPQYNVNYGSTITMVCTVTATPTHTNVYWRKITNGVSTEITVTSNNKYFGSTVNSPSLEVRNADRNDEGNYVCFASNSVGTGQSSQTSLVVSGGIPIVTISSNSYSVSLGGTVTMQCIVTANPTHSSVTWQRIVNGVLTPVSVDGVRISGGSVNSPSLTITNAVSGDEGNYICTASNIAGTGSSQQTFLDVTGSIPVVTVSQAQYSGNYGQTVTLVCSVQANPTETSVYWRKLVNGQLTNIDMSNARYSGATVASPSMTITGLALTDEGFYQCFAQNSVGTGNSQQTFLDVVGNIPSVQVLSNTYSVTLGNTITLGCQVIANPTATNVYWQKLVNGVLVAVDMSTNNNNKYSGSTVQTPSLTIISTVNEDEGDYVCSAQNSVGSASSSQTFLDVTGNIPSVNIPQNAYSVNIASQITIPCTVSATPTEFNIYWTLTVGSNAPQTISTTNTQKYQGSSVNSPSLIILNTATTDEGVYKCHAQNSIGTGQSNPTTLSVIGAIPVVTVALSKYPVDYGNSVQLVCTVTATPTHTQVYWTKVQSGQEVTINTANSAKYSGSTVNNPSLTINNADLNDETFYVCKARNSVGLGQSQQTYVDVSGTLPVVRVQSNSYSVLLGQTTTLVCTISANPSATSVLWYKVISGVQSGLSTTPGKYNSPTVSSPNLVINTAALNDAGYYVCTATNVVGTGTSSQTYLDVTGNIPSVTIALSNYNANIGATVTLGCTVIASPSVTSVYWRRIVNNQQQNIDASNSKYSGSTVSSPSLVISNAALSDEGSYVCYATNSIGTGSSQQTFLDVIGNIPTVTVQDNVYSVNIGSSINLVCNVQANPTHTSVSWQKIINGVTTSVVISGRFSGATVNSPTLTISQAQVADEGYYVCFATNSVGTGQSSQTFLDVIGSLPVVTIDSNEYLVNYGNTATLRCTVNANPTQTSVAWQKIQNGVPSNVVVSGRYQGGTTSSPSLIISNVDNSDEGFYICSATNSVGTGQSSHTYLDVQGNVPVVQILSNYYSVEIGQSVTIQCTVTANPSHQSVRWQKITNGVTSNLDTSSNRYTGSTTGTPSLTISNVGNSDEGYYICTATNVVGRGQSSQTYLDVTGSILTVIVAQLSYSVNYGQTIQLVCTVSGNPSAQNVYWQKTKNGVQTNINSNSNSIKYQGSTTSTPSLTILNADSNDDASYTCFATNSIGTGQSQQTQLSVVGNVPSVTVGQGYTVTLGNSITLQCTVFATPSATSVQWNKVTNNVPVAININLSKYSGASISTPSLTITNSAESDEGYYTCQATNAAGTGTSTQTFLDVQGTLPIVKISQPQYSVAVGTSVTMDCSVSANPAHTSVSWQKVINGVRSTINLGQSNKYSGSTTTNPSLTVQNADLTDESHYVCTAQNSVGTGQSSQTFLDVVGSVPVVNVLSTSYTVNVGNSITLQCTVSANPTETSVTWERYVNNVATIIDLSNSRYSGSSVGSPSLVITNAAISDEGLYLCKASNSIGTGESKQTFLDVLGSIPSVSVPQQQYSINSGSSVTLQCSYTANPVATNVYWEKTSANQVTTISTATSKYSGSTVQSPSLIINNADETDEATYVCKVTNNVGTGISNPTFLDVIGNIPVVTAPTPTYAVNIGDSVTIQCNVAANPLHTSVYWQKITGGASTNIDVANSAGKYTGSSVNTPSLTITNSQLTDQGTYICYATNTVGTGQSTQVVVAVQGSVPSVSLTQTSFTGNYGDTITLGCTISANPAASSVYWQKYSGGAVSTIDMLNTRYSGSTTTTPSLTIIDLHSNDEGNYVCLAANSVGTGQSAQGPLTVVGNLPVVTISQSTFSVNIGNTITLDCVVSASPAHTSVYWTRQIGNRNPERLNSTNKYDGSTTVSPSLTIYNIDMSDEGTYICHAANSVGTGQSSQAFLDVVGNSPTVTATTVSSVKIGNSVTIQCTVTATPAATLIVWRKYINNQPVTIDMNNNRYTGGTTANPSLTISSVTQDDQSQYICQAINSVGTGTSNQVYLTVTGDRPTGVAINPSPITVSEGQGISATCTAQGSPTISYVWYKDNSNTQFQTGSVLQISSSSRSNAGTYRCLASNNYGTADATVNVNIQYAPDVTITSPSQGNGGQTVTIQCSYVSNPVATNVIWTKSSQAITIDGSKYVGGTLNNPSLTISNLAKSDEASYKCSVVNAIGQGDSVFVALTVDTSTAPSYITITPAGVVVKEGESYTLTCDADGDPAPLYEWFHKDTLIYTGKVLTISNALYLNNDGLHTCKATNTKGYRQTWEDVDVQYIPLSAIAQSSISQAIGSPVSLSCDTLANPSATVWEWSYNGNSLTTTDKVLVVDMDSASDAGTYTCRASNQVGQSANIAFTIGIGSGVTGPGTGAATADTSGLSAGAIAAIILAVLFILLAIIAIIICCCCAEYCNTLCCKKKEKIEPQPQPRPKRVEMYYEEPDDSVVEVRKLAIPRFYEEPVVVSEPPTTVVKKIRRKREKVYRPPGEEYEINKYSVLRADDSQQLFLTPREARHLTTERARDNSYTTTSGTRQYYLPDIEYTYDDEEERRRRRRRKKKRSSRHHQRQSDDQSRDNEIVIEERIENGDVLRSSIRSRRSDRGDHRDVLHTSSRSRDYDVVTGPEFYYEQE